MKPSRSYILHFLVVLSCVIFYSYWALDRLSQQGIYCDVGLHGDLALGIYKRIPFDGHNFLHLGHYSFPLMVKSWHGPVPVYLALPWIYAFGNKAVALHLPTVFLGVLSLPLLYVFTFLLLRSRAAASMATVLMATSPGWISATRLGLYTGTEIIFWEMCSLLCFLLWKRKGRFEFAPFGFLFLGLGLGSRIFFVWFTAALGILAFFMERHLVKNIFQSWRRLILCLVAGLFGIFPVILANFMGRFFSLKFVLRNFLISADGYSNLEYWSHLNLRLGHIARILDGSAWSAVNEPNHWFVYLALLCLLLTALAPRRFIFLTLMILLILFQSPVTPTGFQPHHLIVVFPLLCVWMAQTIAAPGRKVFDFFRFGAGGLLLAIVIASNFRVLHANQAHRFLHGGHEVRWNVTGDVVNWLSERNVETIGLGDTGIMDPFNYLSGRSIKAEEIFWAPYLKSPVESRIQRLRERLNREKSGFYLFRSSGNEWIPFFRWFRSIAREEGKDVSSSHVFYTGDKEPVFVLYLVQ